MQKILPVLVTLLISAGLYSCQPPAGKATTAEEKTEAVTDSLQPQALQKLYERIQLQRGNRQKAVLQNNRIEIGDTLIELEVKVEHDIKKEDKQLYATNMITHYKVPGKQDVIIELGVIGIGLTKPEAEQVCLQEWFATFVLPFASMINGTNFIAVNGAKFYPGLMGVRGKVPTGNWLNADTAMHQKIIAGIQPAIKASTEEIIPVDIKLMVEKDGVKEGECRINNAVSADLLLQLQKLAWPVAEEKFMFKQFYLVDKR